MELNTLFITIIQLLFARALLATPHGERSHLAGCSSIRSIWIFPRRSYARQCLRAIHSLSHHVRVGVVENEVIDVFCVRGCYEPILHKRASEPLKNGFSHCLRSLVHVNGQRFDRRRNCHGCLHTSNIRGPWDIGCPILRLVGSVLETLDHLCRDFRSGGRFYERFYRNTE